MKIAVLGATGATGIQFVKQALTAGHEVTAVVRNPEKLKDIKNEKLKVINGDIFSQESLTDSFKGADAVVSCLGFKRSSVVTGFSESIKSIANAARSANIQRIVVMSSYYSDITSGQGQGFLVRWLLIPMLRPILTNLREMEIFIETKCSDMNYTIVRPPGLNNSATSGKLVKFEFDAYYTKGASRMPREDVAKFMIECLSKSEFYKKAVAISL